MNILKTILKILNAIQYLMAAYELFISKRIDMGMILTALSIVISLIIYLYERSNIIIESLEKKYNAFVLNKMAIKYSIVLTIVFIAFEFVCMIISVIYDKYFFPQNEDSVFMMGIFYGMCIVVPIIYTIFTNIILRLEKTKSAIREIHSIVVFWPTVMIVLYLRGYGLTFKETFFMEVLIWIFAISLPSLFCSVAIGNKK